MGNWHFFKQDNSDSGATWSLEQERQHNAANEITDITETTGPEWITPAYDARGNMVTMPKPDSPASAMNCVYDAWNRMVQAKEANGTIIVTYCYDGTGRRIRKLLGADPENPTATYDFYHNPAWQILENRKNGSANPLEQFVWSPRYVHSPVLRWRDTDGNGSLDETLYYTNDANFNVTALVGTDGAVVERYTYDPYGKVTLRGPDWGEISWPESKQNDILFTGHRLDAETGLYYTPFRYYHPMVGRWISRDPIEYMMYDLNLCEYGKSSPGNQVDEFGLTVKKYIDCDADEQAVISAADKVVSARLNKVVPEFEGWDLMKVLKEFVENNPKRRRNFNKHS